MRLFNQSGSPDSRTAVLLSLLALSPIATAASPNPLHVQYPILPPQNIPQPPPPAELSFKLRHILHHGTFKHPRLLRRLDVKPQDKFWVASEGAAPEPVPVLKVKSRPRPIQRLIDRSKDTVEEFLFLQRNGWAQSFTADAWTTESISHPNISDKDTVMTLAKMTADAYVQVPTEQDWMDVGPDWNVTDDFGWEGDGLRGHIFVDDSNTTVAISLKGTSPALFDGADTTTNDKVNDNLLFSCCCARVTRWWKTVCDCYSGTAYTCGKTCLKDALMDESRYYRAALNLYYNVTQMYPGKNVWVVGHSLGGSVSSLLGITYGLPVVTFEAPGEALAASRLGLPTPPGGKYASDLSGTVHFGNSADPIFMGTCTGATSVCAIGGYAMETGCHTGRECLYDVVNDKGWRVSMGYHRIQPMIKDILEAYETVPECLPRPECVDCFNWKFVDSNDTISTTSVPSSKPTKTTTTSTTCVTKGWWGCLDDPTTTTGPTTITTTTIVTTSTTVTCTSYGWFGRCLDETTTTTTTTLPATTTTTTIPPPTSFPTSTLPTETCSHYNWWGKCVDGITSTTTTTSGVTTPSPHPKHPKKEKCKHRAWYGGCLDPTSESTTSTPEPTTKQTTKQTTKPTKNPEDGPDCDWWDIWC